MGFHSRNRRREPEKFPSTETVPDIGMAAFLKMKGVKITRVTERHIEVAVNDVKHREVIESLKIDYINSLFCQFDSMIMSLKRLPVTTLDDVSQSTQTVESLGQAAFIKITGKYRLLSYLGGNRFAFAVPMDEEDKFKELQTQWVNSELRDFDAQVMSIKQMRLKYGKRP